MSRTEHFAAGTSSIEMMTAHELAPYAEPRDASQEKRQVESLSKKISRRGYDATLAARTDGPIRLVHETQGSSLFNGNHRVHAMLRAGYTDPVPVRVERR